MPNTYPAEHQVDALYDEAPCGLLVTDEDGTIQQVNTTFCRWTGYAKQELLAQRRLQDLFTMGGRIFHQTHWAPLMRMQGSITEVKVDLVHRDGSTVPLLINAVRRIRATCVQHEVAVFIAKDRAQYERELMLARQRAETSLRVQQEAQQGLALAEARLRLALDSGALCVWDMEVATGHRCYDDAVARLLGYDGPRPITAQDLAAAMSDEDRQAEAAALAHAVQAPHVPFSYTVALAGVDGVQRVVTACGIGLPDENNAVTRFVGVLQDVTEQARQQSAAEDRARFAEQMVGIVSHDLRNPLSTILMASTLLERDNPTAHQRHLLGHISRAGDRAKRLIAELLDFTMARLGRGIALSKHSIDLHELVGRALAELDLAFPGRTWQHDSRGTGLCQADPDRLVQLLGNLAANAVAYGSPDSPIRVTSVIEPMGFCIEVHNHGPVIPEALMSTMFEPLTRGDAIPNGARSVGLGLYIVREIAHAHGGTVSVRSEMNAGTTFTAHFPRR